MSQIPLIPAVSCGIGVFGDGGAVFARAEFDPDAHGESRGAMILLEISPLESKTVPI